MKTGDFLKLLKNDIHTTIMATVDKDGRPVTRVIFVIQEWRENYGTAYFIW